jgi:hypothetical protein
MVEMNIAMPKESDEPDCARAWRIKLPRTCLWRHKPHRHARKAKMKPLDKIMLRLSPGRQLGTTRLHLSGAISTRLSSKDVRRLWQLIDSIAEEVGVVLSVDAPLPWFDLWTGRLGQMKTEHLSIRFAPIGRRIPVTTDEQ